MPRTPTLVGFAVWLAIIPACTQYTNINTDPEGAEVFIDGAYVGTTPVIYRSRSGLGGTTANLRIEKEGYVPVGNTVMTRVYRADASLLLLLAGIIPFFFSARYENDYLFELHPLEGSEMPATNEGR